MQKLGNNLSLWKFECSDGWWRLISREMCEFIWNPQTEIPASGYATVAYRLQAD